MSRAPATRMPQRVLIVGLPRSGTTLLSTLLAAQPRVAFLTDYFPCFRDLQVRLRSSWDAALDPTAKRVALAVVRDQFLRVRHAVLVGKDDFETLDELHARVMCELCTESDELVGHKLLLPAEELEQVLAETDIQCVLMVRDPRDAALSYFHRTGGGVEGYVHAWASTVRAARKLGDHPRLLTIRYEDLILEPSKTCQALGRFLRMGIDDQVGELHFQRSSSHGQTSWKENSAFRDVTRRFDAAPLGRWRNAPQSAVVRYAAWATGKELLPMGYEPMGAPLSPRERAQFAALWSLDRAERGALQQLERAVDWARSYLPELRARGVPTTRPSGAIPAQPRHRS